MLNEPNILVIDDDETILDSITQVFSGEGYSTKTAENGDRGLTILKEDRPDLVLVDLKMPGKSGMEVLEELKSFDPNCVAIVITGFGTVESAVEAMKKGAYDFLSKPFTPDELRIVVRRALERKRCIEEATRLRGEKEKMRKNFISMVSHELRSPLAAVQQNLMLLRDGSVLELPEKVQPILERMYTRIKGLISLISDWLDLSRIESGVMFTEVGPVDMAELVKETCELYKSLAEEKEVKLQFQFDSTCPSIEGNGETLNLMITNLIHNGIKYNKTGGEVTVSLKPGEDRLKVIVKDTGVGIPEDKLPLIFEQFFRVRSSQFVTGSGLGLSIVKQIVEAHGGSISVESELDKGSTFTVSLPLSQEGKKGHKKMKGK